MKLFDRIFHPEKIEILEKRLEKYKKQWNDVHSILSPEQIQYIETPNDETTSTLRFNAEDERVLLNGIGIQSIYSFKYFPAFITGIELRTLLKSKIQLDSLKEIGLTDEQKLYLELVEGDNNG